MLFRAGWWRSVALVDVSNDRTRRGKWKGFASAANGVVFLAMAISFGSRLELTSGSKQPVERHIANQATCLPMLGIAHVLEGLAGGDLLAKAQAILFAKALEIIEEYLT